MKKLDVENSMKEAAEAIVTKAACLKKKSNVLIICGVHNQDLAEQIMLQSCAAEAYPFLWIFNERLFLRDSQLAPTDSIATLPVHTRSLLEKSDVVIWLSQFDGFAPPVKAVVSFWDAVYDSIRGKPRLMVNLFSAKTIERMGIAYSDLFSAFINAINVDYQRIRDTGSHVASMLDGSKQTHIYDSNGTDLTFSIEGRPVGIEVGTLEECYESGKECEVAVPAGEVYTAPLETSADGTLIIDELKDFGIRKLQLRFEKGRIAEFTAQKDTNTFKNVLDNAKGDKDRIAELGIGINHRMKPTGLRIYDEKALGTAHIAIGNNTHLGGTNKATIHIDFILPSPTIETDNKPLMKKNKLC